MHAPRARVALRGAQRPLDAAGEVVRVLGLPCSKEEYYARSSVKMSEGYARVAALPGAKRLLAHLLGGRASAGAGGAAGGAETAAAGENGRAPAGQQLAGAAEAQAGGVRLAVATSSGRPSVAPKLTPHGWASGVFEQVVCGEDVARGKPAPDIFLECARRCGVAPSRCLVVEDAPAGVEAAAKAGMRVLAVPSLRGAEEAYRTAGACEVLKSLLDARPERHGLRPFGDLVGGVAAPVEAWRVAGEVIKGFGRGGKDIGCPTANLPTEALEACPGATSSCGIYVGWASVGDDHTVHKMVMSVGWNPFYQNERKSVEPHLLHTFAEDFYGAELRLVVCGYLRPELDFDSFQALVDAIEGDKANAHRVLDLAPFSGFAADEYLRPPTKKSL